MGRGLATLLLGLSLLAPSCKEETAEQETFPAPQMSVERKVDFKRFGETQQFEIVLIEKGVEKRLTNHPADDTGPVLSPDQSRICFHRKEPPFWGVYVINCDGTGLRKVTTVSAADLEIKFKWLNNKKVKYITLYYRLPERLGFPPQRGLVYYEDNILDIKTGETKKTGGTIYTTSGTAVKEIKY